MEASPNIPPKMAIQEPIISINAVKRIPDTQGNARKDNSLLKLKQKTGATRIASINATSLRTHATPKRLTELPRVRGN